MLLDTPLCDFGWKAPDFTLDDPDGKSYTMSEQLGEKGLLIAFICNHCPYVKAIADRFADDVRELQKEGINVLAVMSNDYSYVEADSPPFMKQFGIQHNFSFPYLVDENQSVGQAYKAVCTPDFFGFNKDGELQYRGRLDDAAMASTELKSTQDRNKELVNAMKQIANTGHGPEHQKSSMGCSIKWS
jgi:peroxiredoxin